MSTVPFPSSFLLGMARDPDPLRLLKPVSRSFYLTLRVLPQKIRRQIGLAYLLARTTDTIADTELLPAERRAQALQQLRRRIAGTSAEPVDFNELIRSQGAPAERALLEQCEATLALLPQLTPSDTALVREVLDTITSGQELDLRRFAGASLQRMATLPDAAALDDYTYRVAGCVGEFWTKICRAHLFPTAAFDERQMLSLAVRFGKGLQLVNILRDLAVDLRQGRCYLPETELRDVGLTPHDLIDPASESRLRPVYQRYLDLAEAHLLAGWQYTNRLPWTCVRVRLACAWPILIGLETLRLLRSNPVLDPERRSKVSRRAVRHILLGSVLRYPARNAWNNLATAAVPERGASRPAAR